MTDAAVRSHALRGSLKAIHPHLEPEFLEAQFRKRCEQLPVPALSIDLTEKDADHPETREAAELLKADKALWANYNRAVLVLLRDAADMIQLKILIEHMSGCRIEWDHFLPLLGSKLQEPGFFDGDQARLMLENKDLAMDPKLRAYLEKFELAAFRSA
ncbi:MAG TPA: hypothetical protein VD967_00525 [Candidatus Paceibacterota bacterium]|nr:hypothetical protein [Candidatus Paceibacterota bacterium]